MKPSRTRSALTVAAALTLAPLSAEEWPLWRGPSQDGTSAETGLPSSWSPEGENLLWKAPFIGRSTPVVSHGRVTVVGRVGDGITKQEVVAGFDAESGRKLWEHRHNVYNTTVAFNRLGWASPAADAETGNVYVHGAGGQLIAFDKDGRVLWQRMLNEEFGRASGYGGRTQTPIVWGDQLLLSSITMGWGDQSPPRHRYFSFDKHTGQVLWVSAPGGMPQDMNTQSGAVVAEIGGRHLIVAGDADGSVYGLDLLTGNKLWWFRLSLRSLNSTPLVAGDVVFASHSEENADGPTMGRLVAFKGSGSGDLAGQELWRIDELAAGFPSPAFRGGKLFVVDNAADLHRIDAASGKIDWTYGLGTVGKASPVLADGKIYVPEENGRFHILKDADRAPVPLDLDELKSEGERYAELYGSPAVARGRIYLATEGWLYAIGAPAKGPRPPEVYRGPLVPAGEGAAAHLQVTPAEVELLPGESATFRARLYDARGRPLGEASPAWKIEGLGGEIGPGGTLRIEAANRVQGGAVVATVGELRGKARVRVVRRLPWSEDFEQHAAGAVPVSWVGARGKYEVAERDGGKVLLQPVRTSGLQRAETFFGGSFSNATLEADVLGRRDRRRVPDIGLINGGYTLQLMGAHQRLELKSWEAEKRMARSVDFAWETDVWYRMKLRVEVAAERATVRGKVWKRGEPEPEAWTIVAEDPLPIAGGSPGLTGYAPAEIAFDNLAIAPNG